MGSSRSVSKPEPISFFQSTDCRIDFIVEGTGILGERIFQGLPPIPTTSYPVDISVFNIQSIPPNLSHSHKIQWLLKHKYLPRIQRGSIVFDPDPAQEDAALARSYLQPLVEDCVRTLGEAPCRFAFVNLSMKSMPKTSGFLDLEFALLIEDDSPPNREYFEKLNSLLRMKVRCSAEAVKY